MSKKRKRLRTLNVVTVTVHLPIEINIPRGKLDAIMDRIDEKFPDQQCQYWMQDIVQTAIDEGYAEFDPPDLNEPKIQACGAIDRPLTSEEVKRL